jgi:hypothetical protein
VYVLYRVYIMHIHALHMHECLVHMLQKCNRVQLYNLRPAWSISLHGQQLSRYIIKLNSNIQSSTKGIKATYENSYA